jgi:hypothetical protein
MCDKLVFDLSQEVEGSPNVFIRKDWINILDNQNQNYQNNQSIIDTSQLSNSNKYMSYREAYLAVPLVLTMVTPNNATCVMAPQNVEANNDGFNLNQYGSADYAIGLKNWFGQIIHTFTLDYNGTTICQQTPFCNMWNSFKLMTTLSYSDIITQGATIGFYPDTSNSWTWNYDAAGQGTINGYFTANNDLAIAKSNISSTFSASGNQLITPFDNDFGGIIGYGTGGLGGAALATPQSWQSGGNIGATIRTSYINYNPRVQGASTATYQTVGITSASCNQVWKSYISSQVSATNAPGQNGYMQISAMATIYLKHIHSFFNMVPLLKGVFMKLTMNLNNASSTVTLATANPNTVNATANITAYTSTVPVGGVNPLLIPSKFTGSNFAWGNVTINNGQAQLYQAPGVAPGIYWYNISVGATVLDNAINATGYIAGRVPLQNAGVLARSIYLYVPAYTFNPVFEQAYLSNPIKQIKYTDIYQYQVLNINANAPFNNLITNGIANIKSVLLCPYYSQNQNNPAVFIQPTPVYQSPFDPAGCGCTSPMITLGNFNVQISGQNAIYNTQRYTFEEFNNQLYGQNAVNGGLTDGLTSGLINFEDFKNTYGFYYVNVERMLPVEQSVPKSVQILGQNFSTQNIDLWVFIEYAVEISVDLQTGARV